MPSREQHMANDIERGLEPQPKVHKLLDQFAHYPDMNFLRLHRRYLHHKEGIEYVRMRWGEEAAKSAEGHIIDDCGHIPSAIDYYTGKVDNFGYQRPLIVKKIPKS